MRKLLAVLCLCLLTACGFKLRGNYDLPFDTLYIGLPESNELYAALKRNIEVSTKTRVIDTREEAQAVLIVVHDRTTKGILSLSGTGRVTEYQLVRAFAFRVMDRGGKDIIPQSEVVLRRDLPYSDNTVLAKAAETELLAHDMQSDLVNQILRRLSAARLKESDTAAGNAAAR
jgi:LPS-assembly lipoprotein